MAQGCIFITAAEARQSPPRELAIHQEAWGIESAILEAVKLGYFEATVADGTPMTNSSASTSEVWVVDPVTDQLYVPNHGFSTGDTVTVTSSMSLPAPLRSNSYYYVIYVDDDHIKLSASYANAMSGRPLAIDVTAGVTSINLTDAGSGYIQPPAVTLDGGNATTAASARSYLADWGSIISISNTTTGAGYTDLPTVQIYPQGQGASAGQARFMAVGISINNAGTDYRVGDLLSVSGGTGTPATASVSEVNGNGSIISLALSNTGNYSSLPPLAGATTTVMPGGGVGATVNLTMGIRSISMTSGGVDYVGPPRVLISDPSGNGAVASARVIGGSISEIIMISPGHGYVGPVSVVFDSGTGAQAIASMTPSGVSSIYLIDVGGASYTDVPSVTIAPVGGGGSAGSVTMKVVGCQMTSAGVGYSKDDILLVSGGVATANASIRVLSVDQDGRILSYVLNAGGSYSMLPGLESNPVNGGTGTLAAFNLSMGLNTISVAAEGSGYQVPPIVTLSPPPTSGTAAMALASISTGEISGIDIPVSGNGYTSIPTASVSNGSGATAMANLTPTQLGIITVTNPGSGYSVASVSITGGGAYIDATAVANIVGNGIGSIDIIDPGEGYTSIPSIDIDGDGIGATAGAALFPTSVASIDIVNKGVGYNTPPTVTISGDALGFSVLESGSIDRLIVTDPGYNYTAEPIVYLIPGPNQIGVPFPPVMTPQRGFAISTISVTNTGIGYQSAPSVVIAPPQISGGTQAIATASIGAGSGTFAIRPYHASLDYFKAWKGQPLSNEQLARPYVERMEAIISYFTGLGYTINRLTNPSTSSTILWKIQW